MQAFIRPAALADRLVAGEVIALIAINAGLQPFDGELETRGNSCSSAEMALGTPIPADLAALIAARLVAGAR